MSFHLPYVNPFAVIVGTLFRFFLNMYFYSPYGFGTPWMEAMRADKNDQKFPQKEDFSISRALSITGAVNLIETYFLGLIMNLAQVYSFNHAAQIALYLFVAVQLSKLQGELTWEGRPLSLIKIKTATSLMELIALCLLLHAVGTY
ncbi:uncharacterized protein VTP21DRAFT_5482 [Calcarisporiella thermophila]|uniref:uncharacterized protein n=1 Tax=Calcarisporiella thermophila TaxID=911321 RepID=UPI003743502C